MIRRAHIICVLFALCVLRAAAFDASPLVQFCAASGAAFSPLSLPGLAVWLDASDAATLALSNTTSVVSWADKSGTGYSFAQPDITARPVVAASAYAGLAAVRFDGTNDTLFGMANNAVFNAASNAYLIAVCRDRAPTDLSTAHFVVFFGRDVESSTRIGIGTRNTGVTTFGAQRKDAETLQQTASGGVATGTNLISVSFYNWWTSGTNFVNKSGVYFAGASFTAGTTKAASGLIATLGGVTTSAGVGVANFFFPGDICEVIVGNRALTAAQIAAVEAYLIAKWVVVP